MRDSLTSIIIPVFNEAPYIVRTIKQCLSLPLNKEIIVVDNNSSDGSYELAQSYLDHRGPDGVSLYREPRRGKANAITLGIQMSRGRFIVFHDADQEYDHSYIPPMVALLAKHDAVHGCRICNPYAISLGPYMANKYLLWLIRKKYKKNVNDIFTGQRAYRRSFLRGMTFLSRGFELETELTIRTLAGDYSFAEIQVTYSPRTKSEGKKIGFKDFVTILNLFNRMSRVIEKEHCTKLGALQTG
jgi:glycosyltransferase involved in cell wall biosynthesis